MTEQTEEIVEILTQNGQSMIVHCNEVGLLGASTPDEWIAALSLHGLTGYTYEWCFSVNNFVGDCLTKTPKHLTTVVY